MTLDASTVIGTWSMNTAWDIGDDPKQPKKKTYPWGNPSSGYWVFDKAGHFSLMIYPNPALPIPPDPFTGAAQPGWLQPNKPWTVPYELLTESFATASPYAYFGTYKVELDAKKPKLGGNLLLTVVADVMRAYTGTVQTRPFRFAGENTLKVGVPGQYLRELTRLT